MNDREALDMLIELLAIPGQSGQERAVVETIARRLTRAGLPAAALATDNAYRHTPIDGQQGNVALKLPGTVRRPRRMLVAHTDTVPICVGSRPVEKDGYLKSADPRTGLGGDNRAGVAVVLSTALNILQQKLPHPPLTFLWTVQEEIGLQGARHVRLGMLGRPQLAFNFDGGSPAKLTVGATGGYRIKIEIGGIASHAGGAPEEGVSAIAVASLAIADLVENGWHGQITKGRRTGTSNVGVIHGGAATNVVTDRVSIRAEARSHDSKFRERIVAEIQKAFDRAARKVRNTEGRGGDIRFHGQLDYDSFRLSPREPCVLAATGAVEAEGLTSELAVANGGLDANWLTARGIPTVSLGCGQRYIHTTAEELDIDQFHTARRIALRLATDTA